MLNLPAGVTEGVDTATVLTQFLGPLYVQLAKSWIPRAGMWGVVDRVGLVWAQTSS